MTAAAQPITLAGLSSPAFPRARISQTPKSQTMAPSASAKYPPGSAPPSKLAGGHTRISTKTRPGASSPLISGSLDISLPDTPTTLKKKARTSDAVGSARTIGRPTKKAAAAQARDRELAATLSGQKAEPEKKANIPVKLPPVPYVITQEYILKKYKGSSPSLIIHLHPNHFRLDGQEGGYSYTSPMKVLLEAIREGKVPHQFVTELYELGVPFYDGCLIVQVNDHRPATVDEKSTTKQKTGARKIASINNYNECLTPSPFVPFPEEPSNTANNASTINPSETPKSTSDIPVVKEKPKIKKFTTVLFPNSATLAKDIAAATMKTIIGGKPGTPMSARTPMTARTTETKLDEMTALQLESRALILQSGQLILEPAINFEHAVKIIGTLKHPLHSGPPPKPKVRKRTNAEMQADEAAAAEEERMLLVWDEQRYQQSGSSGTQVPLSAVANDQENVFKRFKSLQGFKQKYDEEKKKKEAQSAQKMKSTEPPRPETHAEIALKQHAMVQTHRDKIFQQQAMNQSSMQQHQLPHQAPFTAGGVTGLSAYGTQHQQSPIHPNPPIPQRQPTPAQQIRPSAPPSNQPTPRQETPVQNSAGSPPPPPSQQLPQQKPATSEAPPQRVPSAQPSIKTPIQPHVPIQAQPKPTPITQAQTPQQAHATLMRRTHSQQQQQQPQQVQQPQTRPQTPAANLAQMQQAAAARSQMGMGQSPMGFTGQNQVQTSQSPVQAQAQAQAQAQQAQAQAQAQAQLSQAQAQITHAQVQQSQQAQAQAQAHAQAMLQAQAQAQARGSPALSATPMQVTSSSPANGFIQSPVPGSVQMRRAGTNVSQSGQRPNAGFPPQQAGNVQPSPDMVAAAQLQLRQQHQLMQAQRIQQMQQGNPQIVQQSQANIQNSRQAQQLRHLISQGMPQQEAIALVQRQMAAAQQQQAQQQAMANAAGQLQMNPQFQNLTPQQQQQQYLRVQQMRNQQLIAQAQAQGLTTHQFQQIQLQQQQQMLMQQGRMGGMPANPQQRAQMIARAHQQQQQAAAAAAAQGQNPQMAAAMAGGVRIMPGGQQVQMQPGVGGVNAAGQFQDMNGFVVPAGRGINMNGMMNMGMGMGMGLGRGRGG